MDIILSGDSPNTGRNKINDNFGDQVLVTSGTNALTADWNAGEYKITAGSVSIEDGSAASPSLLFTDDTNTGIYRLTDDSIGFTTNGTVKMCISGASGNVGIGTTGPGSKLSVSGGATFGSGYTASALADGNVAISGNLGIGTTGPGAKLAVEQTGTNTGHALYVWRNLAAATTDSALVNFHNDNAGDDQVALNITQDGTGDIINMYDGATKVFIVKDGGNVGIGTTGPSTILHVSGTDNSTVCTVSINALQANVTASDVFIDFRSLTGSEGNIAGSAVAGVISYSTFTASHFTQIIDKTGLKIHDLLEIVNEKITDFPEQKRTIERIEKYNEEIKDEYGNFEVQLLNEDKKIYVNESGEVTQGTLSYRKGTKLIIEGNDFYKEKEILIENNTDLGTVASDSETEKELLLEDDTGHGVIPIVVSDSKIIKEKIGTKCFEEKGRTIQEEQIFKASPKSHLFKTQICSTKQSKKAIGIYGGTDDCGRDLCLSGGVGKVKLANKGRNLEIGDLLISSDIKGCCEFQSDDLIHNYTVAKITENVNWILNEKERLVNCVYLGG